MVPACSVSGEIGSSKKCLRRLVEFLVPRWCSVVPHPLRVAGSSLWVAGSSSVVGGSFLVRCGWLVPRPLRVARSSLVVGGWFLIRRGSFLGTCWVNSNPRWGYICRVAQGPSAECMILGARYTGRKFGAFLVERRRLVMSLGVSVASGSEAALVSVRAGAGVRGEDARVGIV
ncbi:hypothetical protein BDZ89DRAFT_1069532 [Hymenopellis radicata]|nr:hypothetical protein BDZ89DRAFT_1069532 [Hymenopellis radicata]